MFFDEAHLLFDNAAPALLQQVEQVVRLIRSKGVGVYFVTQNPLDLPDTVLGQLGNRIQHALRAFTPRDQKAVKAAADTFRSNPNINVAAAIGELGVGEALVSFLDEKGMPAPVERALILPPQSGLTPLSEDERRTRYQSDVLYRHYKDTVDNFSAFEALAQQAQQQAQQAAEAEAQQAAAKPSAAKPSAAAAKDSGSGDEGLFGSLLGGLFGNRKKANQGLVDDLAHQVGKRINTQVTNSIGRAITRGILGAISGKK